MVVRRKQCPTYLQITCCPWLQGAYALVPGKTDIKWDTWMRCGSCAVVEVYAVQSTGGKRWRRGWSVWHKKSDKASWGTWGRELSLGKLHQKYINIWCENKYPLKWTPLLHRFQLSRHYRVLSTRKPTPAPPPVQIYSVIRLLVIHRRGKGK